MLNIGVISYSASTLAFMALSLVMLTGWRGRLHGALLTTASVVTAVWAFSAAYNAGTNYPPTLIVPLLEIARDVAWFAFLVRLLAPSLSLQYVASDWRVSVAAGMVVAGCFGFLLLLLYPAVSGSSMPFAPGQDVQIIGYLVLAILGLMLVEQLYRNTLPERRWAIKFLCVGVGGIFVYDFFLYSDALLFKHIDVHWWNARGFVDALVVPLIAVSAARNPEWSLDVYVSRSMVFHTTTLLLAGVYLLAMAGGGYYIRMYGGGWGQVLQATFFFIALLVLMLILFSGQVRARLRVFLSKHFFNYKYDYREEWLRFIKTLSTTEQDTQLRELAIKAIAQIVDSPSGLLWFRKESGHYENTANWNCPPVTGVTVSHDSSLVKFLEEREWVVEIDDVQRSPDKYSGLDLPDWLMRIPRAWMIVPLMQHEHLLGFLVLAQARASHDIDWEDCDLLKTAGRQVASYLGQLQATEALFDARQFETFNRYTTYVIHDLKNIIAQLSLVVSNASKHKHNPEFMEDAIQTVEHSVQKMHHLLVQLRTGRDKGNDAPKKSINLTDVLREVIESRRAQQPVPSFVCHDDEVYVWTEPTRLGSVVGHLIQNAQDATPPDGEIHVQLYKNGEHAVIEVRDTGCGMDELFIRDRLFRPFDSTKGASGMGIGAYEVREWAREQGGEVKVESEVGKGTVFRIRLPNVREAKPQPEAAKTSA